MKLRRARATADGGSPSPAGKTGRGTLVALFALLSTYLFFVVAVQRPASSNAWMTGDWLINYANGFIRRGLIGEISRQLHYSAGVDPVVVVVLCKTLCYATLCASLLLIAARRQAGLVEIAMLLSPALLPFEINDPLGSGRKEIVLLALFASYAAADTLLLHHERGLQERWRFWFLLIALPVLTLVHEGLFFFAPFFFLYGWMKRGDAAGELRLFGLPYVVSAIAMAMSWMFRGGTGVAAAICSSITTMAVDPAVCGGATAALERYEVHAGAVDVQRYLLLAVLTMGPLLWYAAQTVADRRRYALLAGITAVTVVTGPLYVVSEDWGRWMHVTAVLVFVTIFSCKEFSVRLPIRRPVLAAASLAAAPIFMLSWRMPHWIHSPLRILRPSAEHLLAWAQQAYVLHATP